MTSSFTPFPSKPLPVSGSQSDEGPGYVYVIRYGEDLYKVGITRDIDRRFKQLEVGSKTVPIWWGFFSKRRAIEREVHQSYHEYRIPQTEYFQLGDINQVRWLLYQLNQKTFKQDGEEYTELIPNEFKGAIQPCFNNQISFADAFPSIADEEPEFLPDEPEEEPATETQQEIINNPPDEAEVLMTFDEWIYKSGIPQSDYSFGSTRNDYNKYVIEFHASRHSDIHEMYADRIARIRGEHV